MQNNSTVGRAKRPTDITPLEFELRTHVDTASAAFHLSRSTQTLRSWSCLDNGPIRPQRINRYLAWPVADIKRLLAGGSDA